MSVVTYAELRVGQKITRQTADKTNTPRLCWLEKYMCCPFTESDAKSFGALRSAVRDSSRTAMDRLIAAHAVNAGVTLVTNDEAGFKFYPELTVANRAPSA